MNRFFKSKKTIVTFCCFLIVIMGNNNFVNCVDIEDTLISSHFQLFHYPEGLPRSYDISRPDPTVLKKQSPEKKQSPSYLHIHFDFARNNDMIRDALANIHVSKASAPSFLPQIGHSNLFNINIFTKISSSPVLLFKLAQTISSVYLLI